MKKIFIFYLFFIFIYPIYSQIHSKKNFTNNQEINDIIKKNRPLLGATIPVNLKNELGATHVGGKYYFTDQPFILEGSKKLSDLGYGILKLWFSKNPQGGYFYNSNWNVKFNITLKELAQHPYYTSCFNMQFSTIILSVSGAGVQTTDLTAQNEEQEIYELTKYLLTKYRKRNITFIIENWEGDWIMRGGTGIQARWSRKAGVPIKAVDGNFQTVLVPSDSMKRVNAMIKWFKARQNGIERARREIKNTKCRVYHAIEVNKVMESMEGIPGISNYILPKVRVDMVSWSCYDGLTEDGVSLYKGIEYLKNQIQPSAYMKGKHIVFLGEIGIPEQRYGFTRKEIINRWDTYMGVCFALHVPYILQWEIYCNEPKNEELRKLNDKRKTDEMRGFWLIRPDGTKSFVQEYFDQLLQHAGGKIEPDKLKI